MNASEPDDHWSEKRPILIDLAAIEEKVERLERALAIYLEHTVENTAATAKAKAILEEGADG